MANSTDISWYTPEKQKTYDDLSQLVKGMLEKLLRSC